MQAAHTNFTSSPVASQSHNDWAARPTQPVHEGTVPDFWSLGSTTPHAHHPTAATDRDLLKANGAELAPNFAYHTDNQMVDTVDPAFFGLHDAQDAASTRPIPAPVPSLRQCARCLAVYTDEKNSADLCGMPHAAVPVVAWIRGDKAMYPVYYWVCCNNYRLAIQVPGLPQRPFNPICRRTAMPHVPLAD